MDLLKQPDSGQSADFHDEHDQHNTRVVQHVDKHHTLETLAWGVCLLEDIVIEIV